MALIDLLAATGDAAPLAYGSAPGIPWVRIVLSFFFCIALAVATIAFIRARNGLPILPDRMRHRPGHTRDGSGGNIDTIQIVERLNVTPTSQIVLLGKGSQRYLLHLSDQGATVIDRFADQSECE